MRVSALLDCIDRGQSLEPKLMNFLLLFGLLLNSYLALAITFHGVPDSCQRALVEIYVGRQSENVIIDWRPWIPHLKSLGYQESQIPFLIDKSSELRQELDDLRMMLGNKEWTWRDGLTAEQTIKVLPHLRFPIEYLEHLEGFDVGLALDVTLNPGLRAAFLIPPSKSRLVAHRLPFWIHLPNANQALEVLIKNATSESSRIHAARWISRFQNQRGMPFEPLPRIPAGVPDHFWLNQDRMFVARGDQHLIETNEEDERVFENLWRHSKKYPPVIDDHVETFSYGLCSAGCCEEMSLNFLRLLVKPSEGDYLPRPPPKSPVIVRLNGRVVGLIKTDEDTDASMLALQNVVDPRGKLMLAMGGVYRIPLPLVLPTTSEAALSDWPVVDVNRLRVQPVAPLLNAEAWCMQNAPMIIALLPSLRAYEAYLLARNLRREISKREGDGQINWREILDPVQLTREFAQDEVHIESLKSSRLRLHRIVWPVILKRMDQLRRQLEQRLESK